MKRVWVRRATIAAGAATAAVSADKLAQARAAVQGAPDERGKHKELARVLALTGQLDELGEVLERWSTRDPLDADVIAGRADLAARRGDREGSLRILGGTLAASALSAADAFALAQSIGRAYDRLGRREACAFHVAAAELRRTDADAVARAVFCERAQGRSKSAERWILPLKDSERAAVATVLAKTDPSRPEPTNGDVVISATWEGGVDLDVTLLDPSGRRAGVSTRLRGARVEGATARDHETVALSTGDAGAFVVEMTRAAGESSAIPVSGRVTVRALGQTQTVPFTLTGARSSVARVDVRWQQELVPLDGDPLTTLRPFDRARAASSLSAVSVAHCAAAGQGGTGHVTVVFAPTGRVSQVVVDDPTFSGTPAGRCVQSAFFNAPGVLAFSGPPGVIGKSFTIPSTPIAR